MSRYDQLLVIDEPEPESAAFRPRHSANVLLWIITGFFVVGLTWAALTELDRTVQGMGRVVPSSKLQIVSNFEGGVVEEILVKPGQLVSKGDVLVRLSPTLGSSAYGSSAASVAALRARVSRLGAEVRGATPSYGGAPSSQVAVEQSLHAAREAELQGLMAAGNARAAQAEKAVAEAQSVLEAKRSNLETSRRELEMLRPLAEKEIVSRVELLKAENALAVATSDYAAAESAISRAQSSVAEARAATAQARSDWMGRAGMEMSQAQAELSAQQQTLPALSDRVSRTEIKASMSGRINRVLVTTVGGSVSPGSPIAEIVPSDDTLYVETLVRPSDIASVHINQRAKVEITAYNSSVYGSMVGKVTAISPDAVVNEKTGESHYTVEVQTTSKLKDPQGKVLPIGPGMMANVSLLGDKRSVLSYLFTPITKLTEHAFRE